MRMNKQLSFEYQARKNQKSEKDIPDKFNIIKLLKKHFDLIGLTSEVISIPGKFYHRLPDIYIPQIKTVIELDGPIHGYGDEVSKSKDDKERSRDYIRAGVKEIIINKMLTNGYQEEQVLLILRNEGLTKHDHQT